MQCLPQESKVTATFLYLTFLVAVMFQFQCSPVEFYFLVRTLNQVSEQLDSFSEMALQDLKSELLLSIIREVSSHGGQ